MAKEKELKFEEALKRLEEVVEKLEDESVTLEKSIELFEEGTKLSKYCSEILEKAELRIENVNSNETE
ncbi:MAG TPA: exodeoxyribonuclease VII small subunit [Balneolales bacterium]|nr:exodeoxyribonuclease VII small subunit [Balneolales bacterium]